MLHLLLDSVSQVVGVDEGCTICSTITMKLQSPVAD